MDLRANIERLKDYYLNIKKIGNEFSDDLNFIDHLIEDITLKKDANVLDIGTGFGIMAILLAIHGYEVITGEPEVDPEKELLSGNDHEHYEEHHALSSYDWREIAREFKVEDKIIFQYLNAEKLTFPDNNFDGIFMYDALQHIQQKDKAIKQCVRVLKSSK